VRVPALHLRPEVLLRRKLRVQRACAQLTIGAKRLLLPTVRSHESGSGHSFLKGLPMRAIFVTISVLAPILLALSLATPESPIASPAYAAEVANDHFTLPAPKAGRSRPLVVVVAETAGAETTDFVVPYGVLKESGVADVRSVSTGAGPIKLTRGLSIMADETMAQFDAREASGADIVIVPAQAAPKDAALAKWVRAQAAKGATIISVCEGARVLAHAGLLEGKRAVTHFSAIVGLTKDYPMTTWVRDRRYLQDGAIISTTDVTASIPMSLALVEAIGGHAIAKVTARHFGVDVWGSEHVTANFVLGKADYAAAVLAMSEVWTHETIEAPIDNGIDEVSLALQTDAWGRTYRTKVVTTHPGRTAIRSLRGLMIIPDAEALAGRHVIQSGSKPAVAKLNEAFAEMGRRYGPGATRLATLGMEYDAPTTTKE
jgi:putative intracellular protease/amidase